MIPASIDGHEHPLRTPTEPECSVCGTPESVGLCDGCQQRDICFECAKTCSRCDRWFCRSCAGKFFDQETQLCEACLEAGCPQCHAPVEIIEGRSTDGESVPVNHCWSCGFEEAA